ncbi:MAG: pyridoxal phosphate-dependent aminotransferase [Phycisphaeraceae bacterium]|nr:pyridoxal phosphate-dependent aminotransferase [Phycisphaerae bacterium]MBX3391927.1 pyridoxal phosphate-dependent aminotransferase [Phycisphaeraceae bacterium]
MLRVARRVATLVPSVTVAFTNRAKAMRDRGLDVLGFAAGEPDFDTPEVIKRAAIDSLLKGNTKYMPTLGDAASRAAVARKFTRDNSIPDCTPDHVAISAGGKHSLFVALHCLLDGSEAGDVPRDVLLPVPTWVSYAPIAELAGGRVVPIPTTAQSDFRMTPDQLRAAITPSSRLLILNSPSNPCGTMYTPDDLRALAEVVAQAARTVAPHLLVLSDEIYEKIVFGGIDHFSIGSIHEIAQRVITINGLSKAYSMTGWRIGFTACSGEFGREFIKAMGTLQGQMSTNNTSFTYAAIPVALESCDADVRRMRDAFAHRATILERRLAGIPGLRSVKATGAFYAFPDVSAHFGKSSKGGRPINSALEFCEALLAENLVALVPGEDFGGCGKNHIRISFACSDEQIDKGMDRLGDFVNSLK